MEVSFALFLWIKPTWDPDYQAKMVFLKDLLAYRTDPGTRSLQMFSSNVSICLFKKWRQRSLRQSNGFTPLYSDEAYVLVQKFAKIHSNFPDKSKNGFFK